MKPWYRIVLIQWNLSKADTIGTTAVCLLLGGIRTSEASGVFPVGVAIHTWGTRLRFQSSVCNAGVYTDRKANERLFLGLLMLKYSTVVSSNRHIAEGVDEHPPDGGC